jgi:hypothetical protein
MKLLEHIRALLNRRKGRLIQFGELALPEGHKVQAFRKLVLDELGTEGLERDLVALFCCQEDKDGSGRNKRGMKGGST